MSFSSFDFTDDNTTTNDTNHETDSHSFAHHFEHHHNDPNDSTHSHHHHHHQHHQHHHSDNQSDTLIGLDLLLTATKQQFSKPTTTFIKSANPYKSYYSSGHTLYKKPNKNDNLKKSLIQKQEKEEENSCVCLPCLK